MEEALSHAVRVLADIGRTFTTEKFAFDGTSVSNVECCKECKDSLARCNLTCAGAKAREWLRAHGVLMCRRCGKPGHVAQRDSAEPGLPAGRNCNVAIGNLPGEEITPPREAHRG